jgi:hypothetical protein
MDGRKTFMNENFFKEPGEKAPTEDKLQKSKGLTS